MQKAALSGLLALSFILLPFSFLYSSEDRAFTAARQRMIEKDLKGRDIADLQVLEIMLKSALELEFQKWLGKFSMQ